MEKMMYTVGNVSYKAFFASVHHHHSLLQNNLYRLQKRTNNAGRFYDESGYIPIQGN
ncbi:MULTISPECIES: hypothetical protein [Acidiplasma]|uniref:hypothetical protein n=1 Tax=Acidiplasma TaxID=507753 RepID=UPI00138F3714|nr:MULTISPECIES: hypothetical protein [Acidiplasma]